ncbi:hypothetical protein WA026_016950 [Henosepilachna vigintioctopunctata]|uniref:LITAF domain-containing protein n=1 Tax=Henosepilachna vigintioctopunctata TaxID=420089 RepID=A0AAW1U967_9CUCU
MKQNDHKEDKDKETSDKDNTDELEDITSMCTSAILEKIRELPVDDEPQPSTSTVSHSFKEDEVETHTLRELTSFRTKPSISHPSTYEMYNVMHSVREPENCVPGVPSETPPPTYYRTPPTYSAVMRMGPPRKDSKKIVAVDSSKIFARVPPPSYAEVEGIWSDLPQQTSSEEIIFGPDPVYMVCPNCSAIVITETYTQRSIATHFTAVVLCIFGCWPCCILPYFMDSCKNTYHHCPMCNYFFGSYHPW